MSKDIVGILEIIYVIPYMYYYTAVNKVLLNKKLPFILNISLLMNPEL